MCVCFQNEKERKVQSKDFSNLAVKNMLSCFTWFGIWLAFYNSPQSLMTIKCFVLPLSDPSFSISRTTSMPNIIMLLSTKTTL